MKVFFRLSCAILVIFLLVSCAGTTAHPLDYQSLPFEAIITGSLNSIEFCATIKKTFDDVYDVFELTLHSPETLKGMVVRTNKDGGVTVTYDSTVLEFESLDSLPAINQLLGAFSISEGPLRIDVVDGKAAGLPSYERVTRLEFSELTVYTDSKSGVPIKIEASGASSQDLFELSLSIDSFTS